MPIRIDDGTRDPALPLGPAPTRALREVEDCLTAMSEDLGLLRYSREERARSGTSGLSLRLAKSLACLRFLKKRPDIAQRLRVGSPAAWAQLVDLRLAIAQARAALAPTVKAAARAELYLLGEITSVCDQIEDHVAACYSRDGITNDERMRLRAKFEVPSLQRQFYEETMEERRARRARRRAISARELDARRERRARLEAEALLGRGAEGAER